MLCTLHAPSLGLRMVQNAQLYVDCSMLLQQQWWHRHQPPCTDTPGVGHVAHIVHCLLLQHLKPQCLGCGQHILQAQLQGQLTPLKVGVAVCPVVEQRAQVDPKPSGLCCDDGARVMGHGPQGRACIADPP